MFDYEFSKKFEKELDLILSNYPKYKNKISSLVKKINENPYGLPYKKLVNFENFFRYRLGNLRIIIEIKDNFIIYHNINTRDKIYRKL